MVTFTRAGATLLYAADTPGLFFLFADTTQTPPSISAAASFGKGFYAFATTAPTRPQDFAVALLSAFKGLDASNDAPRVGWAVQGSDPNVIDSFTALTAAGALVKRNLTIPFANAVLVVTPGLGIDFDNATEEIRIATGARVRVTKDGTPVSNRPAAVSISLRGAGGIDYDFEADKAAFDAFGVDLRYHAGAGLIPRAHSFSVFQPLPATATIALRGTFDPRAPFDVERTFLRFMRESDVLPTFFVTDVGHAIAVSPASPGASLEAAGPKLVMQRQVGGASSLVPHGSFAMSVPKGDGTEHRLLAGTSGTEVFGFDTGGDALTFTANMPARANLETSAKDLLTDERTTAYISITPAATADYFAQPLDASHFARSADPGVLSFREHTLRRFDGVTPAVPLVPFTGARSQAADMKTSLAIETDALARARRETIGANAGVALEASLGGAETLATPQGLLAQYDGGKWQSIVLAETPIRDAGTAALKFEIAKSAAFHDALQHNKLFLVISDYVRAGAAFSAEASIKEWEFDLGFGTEAAGSVGDGRRLIIFKFFEKSLAELAADPRLWTAAGDFNRDTAKTSRELRQFIADARAANDPLFADFFRKVDDPRWNGIIALNCGIKPEGFPEQARGLVAGINFEQFRAHHFGLEINKLEDSGADLAIKESSLFALIRYRGTNVQDKGAYKFDVPDLTVRFANSEIRDFRCKILLTADELFDEKTSGPANNTIELTGRYEKHDGKDVYTFTREAEDVFGLPADSILESVTLTKVQFATVSDAKRGDDGRDITARFSIWGAIKCRNLALFDVLTFERLQFADLGLVVDVDVPASSQPTIRSIVFDPGAIRFDVSASGKRLEGLLQNFPLKLKALTFAKNGFKLPDFGYFPLSLPGSGTVPDLPKYGFSFDLDLGSLGSLVSSLKGFKAELIFAWRPGGLGFDFGIKLPESSGGRKEIGIEGVIKLIIEDFRFERIGPANKPVYFLQLQCCSVEILGRKLPPDGQLNVYLFADPKRLSAGQVGWFVGYTPEEPPLDYFGLGQRVSPDPSLRSFHDILNKLKGVDANTRELTCGKQDGETREKVAKALQSNALQFRPDLDWLVASKFTVADLLDLGFIFNDPELYSLFLRIRPLDFSFEITYRKVTDNIGVYYTEIGLPEAWRQIEMGAVSITLPFISIELFTNGDFRVDVGFPRELDFSRSFSIQALPFIGSGGFYIGKLSGATTKHPNLANMHLVYEIGFGMKLGLGKEFRKGILRAGLSIAFYGLLEGAVGMTKETVEKGGALPLRTDGHFLQGRFGVVGEIFGHVDFGIMKASVLIRLFAGIGVRLASGEPTQLWIEAGVSVDIVFVIARIRTWFGTFEISIHLSFQTQIRFAWTLGSGDGAGFAALEGLTGPAIVSWVPMKLATKQPLELFFLPDLTLVEGKINVVANLIIGDSFAPMVRALARWTIRNYAAMTGGDTGARRYSREDFEALNAILHAPISLARPEIPPAAGEAPQPVAGVEGLTYANIAAFLSENFDVVVKSPPTGKKIVATHFPIVPYMAVKDDAGVTLAEFHRGSVDDAYQDAIHRYFEELYVLFRRQTADGASLDEQVGVPPAQIVFQDYFDLLIKSAIDELARPFEEDGDRTMTLAELVPETRDFETVGGMATRFFRHGLRLPLPGDMTKTSPLYAFTEQQFAANVPQNGLPNYGFHLVTSGTDPKAGWFRLDDDPSISLRRAAIPELETIRLDPTVPTLRQLPFVRRREASFALQQQETATNAAGTGTMIWPIPRALHAALLVNGDLPLTLHKSDPTKARLDPKAGSIPHTYATVVELPVRRVAAPGGSSVPSIYQVQGLPESSRRLIDALLAADASTFHGVKLTLYSRTAGALKADDVTSSDVFIVKTNHSTESNPAPLALTVNPDIASASLAQPPEFLTLVQQCSIVNSGGFFLHYVRNGCVQSGPDDTCGIPPSAFEGDRAALTFVIEFPNATAASPLHTAVLLPSGAADPLKDLLYLRSDLDAFDVAMEAGCAGFEALRTNPADNAATDEARELEKLYNVLEFAIERDPGTWKATPDALPAGPLQPPEDHPDQAIIDAAAAGDWYYQQVIPLHRFFEGGGDPDDPYRHIAENRTVGIAVDFRDTFGNRLGWRPDQPLKLSAKYFDPIVPLADWPAVEYRYDFAAANKNSVTVTLSLVKDAFEKLAQRENESNDRFTARRVATISESLERYRRILRQLQGPGVSVAASTTLGKSTSNANVTSLSTFVRSVLCYLCAQLRALGASTPFCDALPGCGDPSQPVALPIRIAVAPLSADPKFEISVGLTIARDPRLVDSDVAASVPAAASVTTAIPASAGGKKADLDVPTVRQFAERFEAAFDGFKLGVGSSDAGEQSWWAVREDLITCKSAVANGALPFYFAPRPLLNRLWSERAVPIKPLGNEPVQSMDFTDVDLDAWMRDVVAAFEDYLRPESAVAARKSDPAAFQKIMEAKQTIAGEFAKLVLPLVKGTPDARENLGEALEKYRQRVLLSLAEAYAIDTIVQVPVAVAHARFDAATDQVPPRLYGRVRRTDVSGDDPDYAFSTAKVSLAESGASRLTFLFDAKRETVNKAPLLDLDYTITHLEHHIVPTAPDGGDTGYDRSDWLSFPVPVTISLGRTPLPIALREYPVPPVLLQQSGARDVPRDTAPTLQNARLWKYAFGVEYAAVAQDVVRAEVVYNTLIDVRAPGLDDLPPLPHALARFRLKYRRDLSAADFAELAHYLATSIWNFTQPVAALDTQTSTVTDRYLVSDAAVGNCTRAVVQFDGAGDPVAKTLRVQATECTTGACGGPDPAPTAKLAQLTYRCTANLPPTAVRRREIQLGQLDVFSFENAWAGVQLIRNSSLFTDPALVTDDAFVYQTPLVRFGHPLTPLLDIDEVIPVRAASKQPLQTLIAKIFGDLLGGTVLSSHLLKIEVRFGYPLAGTVEAEVPVILIGAIEIAMHNGVPDTAAAKTIADAIEVWRAAKGPNITDASFLTFDLAAFASLGHSLSGTIPVVRIRRVRISYRDVQ